MQTNEPTDFELVAEIQSGHEAGYDELMGRYKRPVLNFVYRMLGDAAEAEDVAQEVFVRAYQKLGNYRPETKFSTWLFTLARNAAIDRLRWRKRHPTEPLDAPTGPDGIVAANHIRGKGDVVQEASAHEIGTHIAAAVAELPEEQRTAFILSEYHGQSHAEVAAIMRCSVKSVETRLYRAKQFLRRRLEFLLD